MKSSFLFIVVLSLFAAVYSFSRMTKILTTSEQRSERLAIGGPLFNRLQGEPIPDNERDHRQEGRGVNGEIKFSEGYQF